MKKIRILHVASFTGNIGDNANHCGVRSRLAINFPNTEFCFTELEIRQFYRKWNEKSFDEDFVDLANTFDLLMIGGGNYFELWVEHSRTGTTVDIPVPLLKKLTVPTVFYGLGLDSNMGYSDNTIENFKKFLDYTLEEKRFLVSVRNDGSIKNAVQLLGEQYASRLHKIPDGGFFTQVEDYFHPELFPAQKHIVVNLAGDMLEKRFESSCDGHISFTDFMDQFVEYIEKLLVSRDNLSIVFVPHMHRDMHIISSFFERASDRLCRTRMSIAPFLTGEKSQSYIFDLYSKAALVIGTRFHANVCPIGLGVPTIGLVNYAAISNLYEELGILQRTVAINRTGFIEQLDSLVQETLDNPEPVIKSYKDIKLKLCHDIDSFHQYMNKWLTSLK